MTDNIKDRGQAFERKEAMSAEKQFKVTARRNRELAIWAAGLMGHDQATTEAYIKAVIASDLEKAGDADLLLKVHTDLTAAGKDISEQELRARMDDLLAEAVRDAH